MSTKSKRFYLVFYFRGLANQVVFEVAEDVSDALANEIDQLCSSDPVSKVYQFESEDGQSVAVNFDFVQTVRFLWDPAFVQYQEKEYDGAVSVLTNRVSIHLFQGPSGPLLFVGVTSNAVSGNSPWLYPESILSLC